MEEQEKIVVLHTFDHPIEANIIKSKLDAYGIPCFLSAEHMTMLTTSLLSGGIKLHIFERDRDEIVRILASESISQNDDDDLEVCPSCHSKRILSFSEDRFDPAQVVKFLLQLSKRKYCLDCETEFDEEARF